MLHKIEGTITFIDHLEKDWGSALVEAADKHRYSLTLASFIGYSQGGKDIISHVRAQDVRLGDHVVFNVSSNGRVEHTFLVLPPHQNEVKKKRAKAKEAVAA